MAVKLVLLHSPLVGPGTWQLLAPVLVARGHDVIVPDCSAVMRGTGPYYPKIVETIVAAVSGREPLAFVAHSGAGALVPGIVAATNPAAHAVFLDALLPHPGQSWFDTAALPLKTQLIAQAKNGRVPPWHRWWPEGAMEAMLGVELAQSLTASLHEIPLAYFEEIVPRTLQLDARRCGYLQLSEGYAAEAEQAEGMGWTTRRMPFNHLAMLTHPGSVGDALDEVLQTITTPA